MRPIRVTLALRDGHQIPHRDVGVDDAHDVALGHDRERHRRQRGEEHVVRLARAHLAVLPLVGNFQRVLICGRNPSRSADFVREISVEMPGLTIAAAAARVCAAESDVLCTCTSSPAPLFDGHDLRPGTHLNLVGSFQPHTREVDTHTIERSRVIVDTYQSTQSEVGEILIPLREGAIGEDHVAADLHELVTGGKPGRRNPEEITIFKSVGCALEDLVAAELLLASQNPATRRR